MDILHPSQHENLKSNNAKHTISEYKDIIDSYNNDDTDDFNLYNKIKSLKAHILASEQNKYANKNGCVIYNNGVLLYLADTREKAVKYLLHNNMISLTTIFIFELK